MARQKSRQKSVPSRKPRPAVEQFPVNFSFHLKEPREVCSNGTVEKAISTGSEPLIMPSAVSSRRVVRVWSISISVIGPTRNWRPVCVAATDGDSCATEERSERKEKTQTQGRGGGAEGRNVEVAKGVVRGRREAAVTGWEVAAC